MSREARVRVARGVLAGAFYLSLCLAIPSVLFLLLFLFDTINPENLSFLTRFEIENRSGESIRVWVAGTGDSGSLVPLPLYFSRIPGIPAFRAGGFEVPSGGRRAVNFDYDHHNFTLILILSETRGLLALPVDQNRRPGCCWRPLQDVYAVPSLHSLRAATEQEQQVVKGAVSVWPVLAVVLLLALSPVFLHVVRVWYHFADPPRLPLFSRGG